jgi:hypothetical protein
MVDPYATCYSLTKEDLVYISMFLEASQRLAKDKYTWEEQIAIEDEIFKAEMDAGGYLPDECYIIELLPSHYYPHHNADFTINEKWLNLQLWRLVNKSGWGLTPKEYKTTLSHLWMHFKMLALGDQAKTSPEPIVNAFEKDMSESDINALFKSCYEFKVLKS